MNRTPRRRLPASPFSRFALPALVALALVLPATPVQAVKRLWSLDDPVFSRPNAIAVTPDGARAYVGDFGSNRVHVIDLVTATRLRTLNFGTGMVTTGFREGITMRPDGAFMYVRTDAGAQVVDVHSESVVHTLAAMHVWAVSPDSTRLYVCGLSGGNLRVLDSATYAVLATFPGGGCNTNDKFQLTADGARIFKGQGAQVLVIDTASMTLLGTHPIPAGLYFVGVNQDGSQFYLVNNHGYSIRRSSLDVYDTASGDLIIQTYGLAYYGNHATDSQLSPDGAYLILAFPPETVSRPSVVQIVDTASHALLASASVDGYVPDIAVSADGKRLYSAGWDGQKRVTAIDLSLGNTVNTTIAVSSSWPGRLRVTPEGSEVWVMPSSDVIDTLTLTQNPDRSGVVGYGPDVVFSPDGALAYVPTYDAASTLQVYDTQTLALVASIPGARGNALAITPDGGRVYAVDGNVRVTDTATNTLIGTIAVGGGAHAIAIADDGARAWVGHGNSVTELDISQGAGVVASTHDMGGIVRDIAVAPDGDILYVLGGSPGLGSGSVMVLSTKDYSILPGFTGWPAFGLNVFPYSDRIAISPNGKQLLVNETYIVDSIDSYETKLHIYDTINRRHSSYVPMSVTDNGDNFLDGIAVTPDSRRAFVSLTGYDRVRVVNLESAAQILSAELPDGVTGRAYAAPIEADGAPHPNFTIGEGDVPPGLALDYFSGVLSGIPTTAGSYTFTVAATSSAGDAAQVFEVTISDPEPAVVNTRADADPPADDDGLCSLREAILNLNAGERLWPECGDNGAISFDPKVFTGAGDSTITLAGTELAIAAAIELLIDGTRADGGKVTVSGAGLSRVFNLAAGTNATLRRLDIVDGVAADHGGGIRNAGTLTLERGTVTGNSAGNNGGGLHNTGTLTLQRSTVANNLAGQVNTNGNDGGGIYSTGALRLDHSTVSGNSAAHWGGGLTVTGVASSLRLNHSTVADNSGHGMMLRNTDVTLNASVVAGNVLPGTGPLDCSNAGSTYSARYTLIGATGTCPVVDGENGNRVGTTATPVDARLGALADHGGGAPTHVPRSGSPLLDAVACDLIDDFDNATDQRGVARPQGAACDIGAVEAAQFILAVSVSGEGALSPDVAPISAQDIPACDASAACAWDWPEAGLVTLTATPTVGWRLQGWSGDCLPDGGDPRLAYVVMDGKQGCAASFVPDVPEIFSDGFEAE